MRKILKILVALLAIVVAAEIGFVAFLFVRHRTGGDSTDKVVSAGKERRKDEKKNAAGKDGGKEAAEKAGGEEAAEKAGAEDAEKAGAEDAEKDGGEDAEKDGGEDAGKDDAGTGDGKEAATDSVWMDPGNPVYSEWAEMDGAALSSAIDDAAWEIASADCENDGAFDRDGEGLAAACDSVFAFSGVLAEAGVIEGSAKNDEGHTVSFFLNDGSTNIWIPAVKDCMAGEVPNLSVFSADALSGLTYGVITGFSGESAKECAELVSGLPEYNGEITFQGKYVTVEELIKFLQGAADQKIRCWFWRGHGATYTETDGTDHIALVLQEKREPPAYDLDWYGQAGHLKCLASCGDNMAITDRFFTQYLSEVDGGLFYCGSCRSGMVNGILADALFEKGFDAVTGANNDIFTIYSDNLMKATAVHLAEFDETGHYRTISDAFDLAKKDEGESDFFDKGVRIILRENPARDEDFRLADPPLYLAAYREKIRELQGGYGSMFDLRFELIYLDDDTIPELVFTDGAAHISTCAFFTWRDGKVVDLGWYGSFGSYAYQPRTGRIWWLNMSRGYLTGNVFKLKKGEMVLELTYMNDEGAQESADAAEYYLDSKKVSKEKYRKKVEEIESEEWKTAGHEYAFKITEENLDSMAEDIRPFVLN